jgi:hypothetical protein
MQRNYGVIIWENLPVRSWRKRRKPRKKFLRYDQLTWAPHLIVLDMIFKVKLVKSRNYKALSYVPSCSTVLLFPQLSYCLHNSLTVYTTVLLFTQLCYCLINCVTLYVTVSVYTTVTVCITVLLFTKLLLFTQLSYCLQNSITFYITVLLFT